MRELRESGSKHTVPKRIAGTPLYSGTDFYPNLTTILYILAIFLATTFMCERSISALRTLKTWLRSTMTNERFTGLALIQVRTHKL